MKKLTGPLLLIASSYEAADVQYATGFKALDPILFLHHKQRKYLVVPALELGRAKDEAPQTRVFTPGELGLNKTDRRKISAWAVALLKQLKIKRLVVSSNFPIGCAEELRKADFTLRIATSPLYPGRAVKNKKEIAHLREAQRAAVAGMQAARSTIEKARVSRTGYLVLQGKKLTSEQVRFEIDKALLARNCVAQETIVAGGRQGADPHDRGHGPLRSGVPIVIDIFPQHRGHGYWGDITRTVVRGEVAPELRTMYSAVRLAQSNALKKVKAGVRASSIHSAVTEVFKSKGYETCITNDAAEGFIHSTGHGVGLNIHEAPSVSLNHDRLRVGHVITVEPGLYYYDLGGIRIEDTVEVTATGYRYLATCAKRFEI